MVQYSSPLMDVKQLQQCLDPIHALTDRDIAKPTPEVMRQFYEAAVRVLIGRDGSSLDEEEADEVLDFPDLYADAASNNALFNSLRDLFSATGVEWFAMRDLTRPDPERTHKLLSSLANFKHYGEQYAYLEAESMEAYDQQLDAFAKHQETAESLSSRRDWQAERRREEDEAVAEVAEEVAVMEKEVQRVTGELDTAEETRVRRMAELTQHMDKIAVEKQQAAHLTEEENSMQMQIVESPHELKLSLVHAEEAMEREKRSREEVLLQTKESRRKADVMRKALAELQSRLQTVGKADQAAAAIRQAKLKVAARQAEEESSRQQQAAVQTRLNKERAKAAEEKARIAARKAVIEEKLGEIRRKQADVRVLEDGLADEEHLFLAAKAEVQGQLQEVRRVDERCQEQHRQKLTQLTKQFCTLYSQVCDFHRRLTAYMDQGLQPFAAFDTRGTHNPRPASSEPLAAHAPAAQDMASSSRLFSAVKAMSTGRSPGVAGSTHPSFSTPCSLALTLVQPQACMD